MAAMDQNPLNRRGVSIIIPVYNEVCRLPHTIPSILAAVKLLAEAGIEAELAFVCNGCRDDSSRIIREHLTNTAFRLIELPEASKTAALNVGDSLVHFFPRFYVDADVIVPRNIFLELYNTLQPADGCAGDVVELVSPKIEFDTHHATLASRQITHMWKLLPHGDSDAFHHVLGLSAQGRERWREFPKIIGDDAFIVAQVPSSRRKLVDEVAIITWAPSTFWSWVRVRERWERGHHELVALGLVRPSTPGQGKSLLRLLSKRKTCLPAFTYISCRLIATVLAKRRNRGTTAWYSDRN